MSDFCPPKSFERKPAPSSTIVKSMIWLIQEGTGSVRFGKIRFPVRRGSACVFRAHRGLIRFGSFPHPVQAGSRI